MLYGGSLGVSGNQINFLGESIKNSKWLKNLIISITFGMKPLKLTTAILLTDLEISKRDAFNVFVSNTVTSSVFIKYSIRAPYLNILYLSIYCNYVAASKNCFTRKIRR